MEQCFIDIIERHENVALQYSGGRDSTVLLHMCLPWKDRITVVFVDTGDCCPTTARFVAETCCNLGYRLHVESGGPRVLEHVLEWGVPSPLVPVWGSGKVQSTVSCCRTCIWEPLHKASLATGATLLLRGSKACDKHQSVGPNGVWGIEIACPLWYHDESDIADYVQLNMVELPPQYAEGVSSSIDCLECTGYLGESAAQIDYIRRNYPESFARLQAKTAFLATELSKTLSDLNEFTNEVL